MKKLNIGVVGGGIFGITAAVKLAQHGHTVDIFEKNPDILEGASGINQFRLHRGYHYPRSLETAFSSQAENDSFREEYPEAVIEQSEHYYCISRRDSLTSADQFRGFCDTLGLEYTMAQIDILKSNSADLCVNVNESLLDATALRSVCWRKLRALNVNVHLGTEADEQLLQPYDFKIVATYSANNSFLAEFPEAQKDYQFELCEKPIVRLSERFKGKSIVVMDGPFMCIDPLACTGLFVLGNVVHAIHQTNVGKAPLIPDSYKPLINCGVIDKPPITRFDRFISSATEFFYDIQNAEHVGSMFTIRTVLPYKDDTDERPTIVEHIGNGIITIFSGKLGTCVAAANQVSDIVENSSN